MARRVKIDMTGVESFNKASEGQHVCRILSIEEKSSQGGNDMLQCCFEVVKGADKGCRVYENYPLVETALWKLKGMLQAIGMKAEGKISLDLDKLIGKQLIVEVVYEEYNGQERARVAECRKLVADSEDDEDLDEDEEDFEDEDEEEEEEKPKKKPAKKAPAKKNTTSKKKAEPEPEEDEDEDDFEDEEEEEEKPKKKSSKKAAKKATPKKATKKKEPEPEEEDEDWDEDEEEEDWEEA